MATTTNFHFLSGPSVSNCSPIARFSRRTRRGDVVCYIFIPEDICQNWTFGTLPPIDMPPFPTGDWNLAHLVRDSSTGELQVRNQERVSLVGIANNRDLSQESVEYFSLRHDQNLTRLISDRTMRVRHARMNHGRPMVMKIMAIPDQDEKGYIDTEVRAYGLLRGSEIAPRFLGFVTENGRRIGFLTEYIDGARRAEASDFEACRQALEQLHQRGIVHGDTNLGNFLVTLRGRVLIIDFETAYRSNDVGDFMYDMDQLVDNFTQLVPREAAGPM